MKIVTATRARRTLCALLDELAVSNEPIRITGQRASAVLVSKDDWRAIQETLYLISVPGLAGSMREGMATPVEACVEGLDW